MMFSEIEKFLIKLRSVEQVRFVSYIDGVWRCSWKDEDKPYILEWLNGEEEDE